MGLGALVGSECVYIITNDIFIKVIKKNVQLNIFIHRRKVEIKKSAGVITQSPPVSFNVSDVLQILP